MKLIPLGPRCVAELRGVDLIDVATSDAAYRAVREAFEEHSVILFRDQEVSDDVQVAFSRAFGPLERTRLKSAPCALARFMSTSPTSRGTPLSLPQATARRSRTGPTSSGIPTVRSRRRRPWPRFCRRGRSLTMAARRSSSRPGLHGTGCRTDRGKSCATLSPCTVMRLQGTRSIQRL